MEREIAEILSSDPVANRDSYARVPGIQKTLDAAVERWAELESRAGA